MNDHIADEVARTQRLRTLLEGRTCARCGETDLEMIRPYSRIDLHHEVRRANDPGLVVYLCSNCHYWAGARLKELGIVDLSPKPERNLLEVVALVLKAVGCTLRDLSLIHISEPTRPY